MDFYNGIGISPLIDYMEGADVDNWMLEGSQDLSLFNNLMIEEIEPQDPLEFISQKQSINSNSSSGFIGVKSKKIEQQQKVCEEAYNQLINEEGKALKEYIKQEVFPEEDLIKCFSLFNCILHQYKGLSTDWIIRFYNEIYDNDEYLARYLAIIAEFADREDFSYIASLFAKAEINNRSEDVINMAMSVIDNLPSEEAQRMMATINPPQDMILRLKYNAIISDLSQ